MIRINNIFGMLRWFFTPVKLYGWESATQDDFDNDTDDNFSATASGQSAGMGDDDGVGSGSSSNAQAEAKAAAANAQEAAENARLDAEIAAIDAAFSSLNEKLDNPLAGTVTYDEKNTLDIAVSGSGWFAEDTKITGSAVGSSYNVNVQTGTGIFENNQGSGYNSSTGEYTYEIDEGFFGLDATYEDSFGVYDSKSLLGIEYATYTKSPGVDSIADREHYVNGSRVGSTDVHYDLNGDEIGIVAEMVIDAYEFVFSDTVSPATSTAVNNVINAIGTVLLAGPTAPASIAAVVTAVADVLYATGLVSLEFKDTAKAVAGYVMAAGLGLSFIQSFAGIASLMQSGYLNSAEMVLAGATLLGIGYTHYVALEALLNKFGLNPEQLDASMIRAFALTDLGDAASSAYADTGNMEDVFSAYSEWIIETSTDISAGPGMVAKDKFAYMAGGTYYDIQDAGSQLFLPIESRKPTISVMHEMPLEEYTRQSLFQNDKHYEDLQPISTTMGDPSSTNVIAAGKQSQFTYLVEVYNEFAELYTAQIDLYNAELETFNDNISSIKTQDEADTAIAALDNILDGIMDVMDDIKLDIDTVQSSIDDLLGL